MEKNWRLDLEVPDSINERRKKLGKKWREVIYQGLDTLEKAVPTPNITTPEEELRQCLKRIFELYKEK